MLDRRVVLPYAPRQLVRRQREQWLRSMGIGFPRRSQKHSDAYKWPCWQCGTVGILGVGGFGAKGLIRPRNVMCWTCWEKLDPELRKTYAHRDRKVELRKRQRRRSKRNMDRVAIRKRQVAR